MASPESRQVVEDRERASRREAMKKQVIAAATAAAADTQKEKTQSSVPSTASISKLSAIIRNHNPPQRISGDRLNHERTSKTRLGEMARNPPTADVTAEAKDSVTSTVEKMQDEFLTTDGSDNEDDGAADAAKRKKHEAFQRALLSARIANDAKAKIFGVLPKQPSLVAEESGTIGSQQPSGPSQILQDQNKQPTLSQQSAFTNSNRRTTFFPEKTKSHLSRLLRN